MSAASEKKEWFVFIGDHHEGPFTVLELRGLKDQSQVSVDSFVWKEGMPDWVSITTIPELAAILKPVQPTPPPLKPPTFHTNPTLIVNSAPAPVVAAPAPMAPQQAYAPPPPEPEPILKMHSPLMPPPVEQVYSQPQGYSPPPSVPVLEITGDILREPSRPNPAFDFTENEQTHSKMTIVSAPSTPQSIPLDRGRSPNYSLPPKGAAKKSSTLSKLILSVIVVGGVLIWGLQSGQMEPVVEMLRPYGGTFLDRLFPPVPHLQDVSESDMQLLNKASTTKSTQAGALALVLSQDDVSSPRFYVAANLNDGAQFEVEVVGRPDTLLNQFSFTGKGHAVLMKRLGRTQRIQGPENSKVPQGEYDVTVYDSTQQPPVVTQALSTIPADRNGRHMIERKVLFLGGPRDDAYVSRLNEFHDKVKKRVTDETSELTQLTTQLGQMVNMTATRFFQIRQLKAPALRKVQWMEFKKQWEPLFQQLEKSFQARTADVLTKEFMFGSVFALAPEIAVSVRKLHQLEESFITRGGDPRSFDIQHQETLAKAEADNSKFAAEINKIVNGPRTPRGLPILSGTP